VTLDAWKNWIQGSPIFIWAQKLKATKKAIRDWVQIKATQEKKKDIQEMTTPLEEIRGILEEDLSRPPF
jgi:hypothetical protein